MHNEDAWQRSSHVLDYLTDIRPALPLYEQQIDLIPELVRSSEVEVAKLLDIGTGDGEIALKLLTHLPDASAVMVDFSDTMLDAAKQRTALLSDRTEVLKRDISLPQWLDGVSEQAPFDLVVSGLCIHHLEDRRKQEIYREVYQLLSPGGLFINVDHVAATNDWGDQLFDRLIVDAVYQYQNRTGRSDIRSRAEVEEICRNDDDKPTSPILQCEWLREIGFEQIDIFFKWLGVAIFGGVKARGSYE